MASVCDECVASVWRVCVACGVCVACVWRVCVVCGVGVCVCVWRVRVASVWRVCVECMWCVRRIRCVSGACAASALWRMCEEVSICEVYGMPHVWRVSTFIANKLLINFF